ncbi:SAG-related sequence [Besnoitia besnoiti]|uniref:SAG-related sequence n=1 Tax=Besnoitia besnoiti TaxID=94643 RepID=A0A2A9MKF8_BESBE|nr:SAG-related sequence [Besnoitia besnoiti]PFH36163.1 SAG-related sequence [Besnoitia besnoiti]
MLNGHPVCRRGGGLMPKARRFLSICLGGTLLLSGLKGIEGSFEDGLRLRGVEGNSEDPSSPATVATCQLKSSNPLDKTELTLSKESPTVSLRCQGEQFDFVPKNEKNVCISKDDKATLKDCRDKPGDATSDSITLEGLLGTKGPIQWSGNGVADKVGNKERTLKLDESQLPFADKSFFVGCLNTPEEEPEKCKVKVSVLARESSVKDNVVTCAYGADSNKASPLKVDLTEANSTLELFCGTEGMVQPESYTSKFCEDEAMKKCENNYKDTLPGFEATWWMPATGGDESTRLTIPASGFPAEDQSFYVGCSLKSTLTKPDELPRNNHVQSPSAKSSPCKVLVTVKAASSDAAAVYGVRAVTAPLGIIALTGIFACDL